MGGSGRPPFPLGGSGRPGTAVAPLGMTERLDAPAMRPRGTAGIIRAMNIREETLTVGGVEVHTWVAGQGDPLLVLHGAGGNRGFTRSMRALAERYTVWAPSHPGFGRSDDAEWMEG